MLESVPADGNGLSLPLGLVSKNDSGECNTARNEVLNIARLAVSPAKLKQGGIGVYCELGVPVHTSMNK